MTLAVPVSASLTPASGAATTTSCSVSTLAPTVGRASAAAGTTYVRLLLTDHEKGTNASVGACVVSGTPETLFGNVLTSGTGIAEFAEVGPPAAKQTLADRGKTVTLKPGAVASVTVGIETAVNFVPAQCRRANATRIRLVFNSGATFDYAIHKTQVCTKLASTTTSGIVLGTRYP